MTGPERSRRGEILSEEHVLDALRALNIGAVVSRNMIGLARGLTDSHEALRAKVEDYEKRGMGKLGDWTVVSAYLPIEGESAGCAFLMPPDSGGEVAEKGGGE